jgi:hypothetical protein
VHRTGLSSALRTHLVQALHGLRLRLRQPQLDIFLSGEPTVLEATPALEHHGFRVVPQLLSEALLASRPVCLFPCNVAPTWQLQECQAAADRLEGYRPG